MERKYGGKKRKGSTLRRCNAMRANVVRKYMFARPRRRYAVTAVSNTRGLNKPYSRLPVFNPVIPKNVRVRFVSSFGKTWSGAATGQAAAYVNSIYQPDGSFGSTVQPVGYDQWVAFFRKYVVYSGIVESTFMNQMVESADASKPVVKNSVKVCIWLSANADSLTGFSDASSQPGAQVRFIPPNRSVTIRTSFDCARIAGHPIDADTDGAIYSSNPSDIIYLRVWVLSTPANYNVDSHHRIVMNTELFDYRELDQSVR